MTREPVGSCRQSLAGVGAAGCSLLQLLNTLNLPPEETVTIALPSGDKSACTGGSPPPPRRHVCFTWRDTAEMRLSSPRAPRARTARCIEDAQESRPLWPRVVGVCV